MVGSQHPHDQHPHDQHPHDQHQHDPRHRSIPVYVVDHREPVRRGLVDLLTAHDDLLVLGSAAALAEAWPDLGTTDLPVVVVEAWRPPGGDQGVWSALHDRRPVLRRLLLVPVEHAADAAGPPPTAGTSGLVVEQLGGTDLVAALRLVGRWGTVVATRTRPAAEPRATRAGWW